eukprot:c15552_g1_i1.p1 GENE.c15552_g1_i1~~c15552_g1_i1.p1  ORF type:complete len:371 (+),score=68.11 c15552_g1_i1:25-1113(+)
MLVLLCLVGLVGGVPLDTYWRRDPRLPPEFETADLDSLPRLVSGEILVDPWNYTQRLSLVKHLIQDGVVHCAWANTSTQDIPFKGNFLWGLILQFGWQKTTGRLEQNSSTSDMVSTNSWWANMNYWLNVVPYLGAVEAGVAPRISALAPRQTTIDESSYCLGNSSNLSAACKRAIEAWSLYFTQLNTTAQDCPTSPTSDEMLRIQESLLKPLWDAHTTSIHLAGPLFNSTLPLLSPPEASFGTNWAQLVEFIAAALFFADFETISSLQSLLPPRALNTTDRAPNISDFTPLQNRGLEMLNILGVEERVSGNTFLALWKRAMCSVQGRKDGRRLLTSAIQNPSVLVPGAFKLIFDIIFVKKDC